MENMMTPYLLAAAMDPGPYVDLIKVAVVLALFLGWAVAAQWVDRDTDVVKTTREQWNMIVLSGGAVGMFVLLVVPVWRGSLFAVGLLVWLLLAGGAMMAYIIHRNSRVGAGARVLTMGHLKRLAGSGGKKKIKDKGQRVQITDHAGKHVELPDDPEEAAAFQDVQEFLFDLLWRRASDADVLAGKEKYRLVYRIDGMATERPDGLSVEEGERILRFMKKIAGLNVEEIRRPQTGEIQTALLTDASGGRTEVHTSGTTAGERLRIKLQSAAKVMRLTEIGMPKARVEAITHMMAKPTGLFLMSSPPAHGRTTTQYAVLRAHYAYMNNIHTLERRPLAEIDNVTQQKYEGANTDVNYARMLQTVLRREPNIIMVGECEDRETAMVATRAAAQDRKVYLGIEAKDTFEALNSYVTLVNDHRTAAKVLLGVVNQRLVRMLCKECREAFEPDAATLKKLNLPADKIEHFYRPPSERKVDRKGREIVCLSCQGTGYVGRTAIFELLQVDDDIRKLIAEGAQINRIKSECRKHKMYYLQEEGLLKVIDGTTSMNEILRCIRSGDK